VTRLTYVDVVDYDYITSDASLVLTPVQQSLAVQAVSVFRELYNWTDGTVEADNIDALVADTITALLATTIPPRENMNNRILLFPYMATIAAGNPFLLLTNGAWAQNAPSNGSTYQLDAIKLAAGQWYVTAHAFKGNNAGILRIDTRRSSDGVSIDNDSVDLYAATASITHPIVNDFTLTVDTEVFMLVIANGKNASSSNYQLPILSIELTKVS